MTRSFITWPTAATLVGVLTLGAPSLLSAQDDDCRLASNEFTEPAVQKLTQATEVEPDAARKLYEEALKDLEPALSSGADATALWLAAEAKIGLGEYEEADELLVAFVTADSGCRQRAETSRFNAWAELYNQAIQAYQAGDESASLEMFLSASIIRKDSRSYNNAGLLYQNTGQPEEAIEQFRLAARHGEPLDQARDASVSLSEALRAEGRDEEAVEALREFADAHEGDMLAEMNYAIALVATGDAEAAQSTLEGLLERDDLSLDQWNQVGVGLYTAEAYEDAIRAFRKAYELNPYNRDAINNLATAAFEAGEFDLSAELGETLVQWFPYDFDSYTLLANSKSQNNDAAGALRLIQERGGLAFSFQNVQFRERGGNAYVIEGEVLGRADATGSVVTVPVEFLSPGGEVTATEQLQVAIPGNGQIEPFQVEVTSETPLAGYRYQKASDG